MEDDCITQVSRYFKCRLPIPQHYVPYCIMINLFMDYLDDTCPLYVIRCNAHGKTSLKVRGIHQYYVHNSGGCRHLCTQFWGL